MDILNDLPELRQGVIDEVFDKVKQPVDKFLGIKELCPIEEYDADTVTWRIYDSATGLMAPATSGEPAPSIQPPGMVERTYTPIPFKESYPLSARELDFLLQQTTDVRLRYLDNIAEWFRVRAQTRMEHMFWDALDGTLAINENGHTYSVTYSGIQTFTPTSSWQTSSTDIKGDLISVIKMFQGTGARIDTMVLNTTTFEYLLDNNYFKAKLQYSATTDDFTFVSKILDGYGIKLRIYDEGYQNSSGSFVKFVADDKVYFFGTDGANKVGKTLLARDPNTIPIYGKGKPGFWSRTIVHDDDPYSIELVGGFVGIPAFTFPSWIVYVADVTP